MNMHQSPLFQYTAVKNVAQKLEKKSSFMADMGDEATGWKDKAYQELLRKHPWLSRYSIVCDITASDEETAAVGHFIVSEKRLPATAISMSDDQNRIMIPIIIEKRRLKPLDMFSFRLTYYPLSESRAVPILTSSELFGDIGWGEAESLRRIENGLLGRRGPGGFGSLARLLPNFKQSGQLRAVATAELDGASRSLTKLAHSIIAENISKVYNNCAQNRDMLPMAYSVSARVNRAAFAKKSGVEASSVADDLRSMEQELYAQSAKVSGIEFKKEEDSFYSRGLWGSDPESGQIQMGEWRPEVSSRIIKVAGTAGFKQLNESGKYFVNLNRKDDRVSLRRLAKTAEEYETSVLKKELRKLSAPLNLDNEAKVQKQRVVLVFDDGAVPGLLPEYVEAWKCSTQSSDKKMQPTNFWLMANGQIAAFDAYGTAMRPANIIPVPWSNPPEVKSIVGNGNFKYALVKMVDGSPVVLFHSGNTIRTESGEEKLEASSASDYASDEFFSVPKSDYRRVDVVGGISDVPEWSPKGGAGTFSTSAPSSAPEKEDEEEEDEENKSVVSLEKTSENEYRLRAPVPVRVETAIRHGVANDRHFVEASLCAIGMTAKESSAMLAWADRFYVDQTGIAAEATVDTSILNSTRTMVKRAMHETKRRFEKVEEVSNRMANLASLAPKIANDLFAATRSDVKLSSDIGGVDPGVDTILSLGFLTRKNIIRFAEAADDMQRTQSQLCALTIACRLGLRDIPEEACVNAIQMLEEVITSLKAVRHLLAT
jgi:hypothetical protein